MDLKLTSLETSRPKNSAFDIYVILETRGAYEGVSSIDLSSFDIFGT